MGRAIVCGLWLAVFGQAAQAQEITALAISPDGATLLAAGDNRVIYTLDATALTVSDRRYEPEQVRWMTYSDDGQTVFWRTQDRTFSARAAGSFKERFGAEKIVSVSYARDAGRIALLENNYKGGVLHVVAATSGKKVLDLEMPEMRTDDVVLSADASTALMLTNSESSDAEEKAQPGSDLKGHAKYEFRQQHDGYISKIVTADLNAGTFDVADTWFRVSSPSQVRMMGEAAAFVNGVSDTGLVRPDGTTVLLDLGERFASFVRISDDGKSIVLTNGPELQVHALQGTAIAETPSLLVKAGRMAGPAERVTAMAEGTDGTLYFGTSAYRVWKLAQGATAVEIAEVF